jgi:hypothetical protein
MDAFDQNGNVKWSIPDFYPVVATADGGLVAQSDSGQYVTFDQNGVATGMLADLPQLSWKGAYHVGSVESVVPAPIDMAATSSLGAASRYNKRLNSYREVTHASRW